MKGPKKHQFCVQFDGLEPLEKTLRDSPYTFAALYLLNPLSFDLSAWQSSTFYVNYLEVSIQPRHYNEWFIVPSP